MISEKRLEEAFPSQGRILRTLMVNPKLRLRYVEQHSRELIPRYHYEDPIFILQALNIALEAHGLEAIAKEGNWSPDMIYINMGDLYITTIIYDRTSASFKLQDVGTWLEIAERRGRKYP